MRIIYFDLDTLRPDHLGCYGYERDTSPNIDRIAAEGMRFNNYYCSDAPCLPSRTAMMTGRFGIHNGCIGHGGTAGDLRHEGASRGFKDRLSAASLPGVLNRAGLHTAYIGGFGERHSSYNYYAGFREIHDTGMSGMESAEHVTPTVMKWLDDNVEKEDWYLHINYWDPHTPYRAPLEFGNPFENEPLPSWITEEKLAEHVKLPGPHTAQDINMWDNKTNDRYPRHPGDVLDMDGYREMIDGYDCGIRYMDEHIGSILDYLEEAGVLEDTVIIVSADHGENLGELGSYAEHGTADEITCRIPFIVKWPEGEKGVSVDSMHYNLDLLPTYADIMGLPREDDWDGKSFKSTIFGGEECGYDYLVLSQCAHVCQRAVRWDDYIYIRTYHDGFHLYDKEMLFNLKEDPFEENNLVESNPELCYKAVYMLNEWYDEMMHSQRDGYDNDPMWTVIHEAGPFHSVNYMSVNYDKRLDESGRGYAKELFRERHPKFFAKHEK